MTEFEQLGISKERADALRSDGIQEATPIQEGAIPVILQGKDVICQAQTGTGKTLAFLLPMLERIDPAREELRGLILTPTRELALQITTELKRRLLPEEGFRVLAVYGGQDVEAQLRKLERSIHLVVATPGRLLDHIRRGTIALHRVSMLVLDEADQMLHMGFLPEVESVLEQLPYRRQTMLFSATMPESVRSLAARFMQEPENITVRAPQVTVKGIRQLAVETTDRAKQQTLCRLLDEQNPYLGVIFCRTKRRASALNEALQQLGYNCDELHGDLSQSKREQVMKRFRDAKLQLLIATDVAARGLDVEGVTHVFNYDIPRDAESYIHRIGRTGRAGEEGAAITLVAPKDRQALEAIERGIRQAIPSERGSGVREGRGGAGARGERGAGMREGRGGAGARGERSRREAGGERGAGVREGRGGAGARGERSGREAGGERAKAGAKRRDALPEAWEGRDPRELAKLAMREGREARLGKQSRGDAKPSARAAAAGPRSTGQRPDGRNSGRGTAPGAKSAKRPGKGRSR